MRPASALLTAVVVLAIPSRSSAFCRTTTANVPANLQPSGNDCYPAGTEGWMLYWANRCVGWSMQNTPSSKVDIAAATQVVGQAFASWADADCGSGTKPSIAFTNNGTAACTTVGYNDKGANQHVISFRDSAWPYAGQSNATLALTTLTYDRRTGEIRDADMEVNTAEMKISTAATPAANAYDLLSIVTHEAGHFIGLAHAVSSTATMFARYSPGQTSIRVLSDDDKAGVCEVYRSNGARSVSETASSSGLLDGAACDPLPFGGFSSLCNAGSTTGNAASASTGTTRRCSFAPAPQGGDGERDGFIAAAFAMAAVVLRRRRP